jgi:hypothetical protein
LCHAGGTEGAGVGLRTRTLAIALICHREKRSDVATSVKVRSVIGLAASLRSSQ